VATDASLTKPQAMKMAQAAHDGLARAIRPAHTMFDGDTVFALATGRKPLPEMGGPAPTGLAMTDLGRAAADCFARAVIRAVLAARTLAGITAFVDLPDRR
jgi:L-aminopeptidase/D-esterase-like protein